MVGTLVAMMTVILGMAISRYVPKNVILQIRHIIPQSFIDNFKRDPLGTLRSIKNIKMPTNLDQLRDMIPDKLFTQQPTVDNATSNVTAPDHVEHVDIAPPAPVPAPAPVLEPVHVPAPVPVPVVLPVVLPEPEPQPEARVTPPLDQPVYSPMVSEDMGIIVNRPAPVPAPVPVPVPLPEEMYVMPGQPDEEVAVPKHVPIQLDMNQFVSAMKAPSRTSSSLLQINTDDLAAVRAFLDAKGTTHNVLG